jgi:hypothetical protein
MKLGSFESIKVCIYNNLEVSVSSILTGCDFTLQQVEDKIEVVKHHENDAKKVYFTFRNGDQSYPDLENFLRGWVETINSTDCVVYIFS